MGIELAATFGAVPECRRSCWLPRPLASALSRAFRFGVAPADLHISTRTWVLSIHSPSHARAAW